MVNICDIRLKIHRGENRPKEEPAAQFTPHEIGMLTLPAETRFGAERLFHHRCRVHENFDLSALTRLLNQPAANAFEAFFDDVMIITVAGIDRNGPRLLARDSLHGIIVRRVAFGQHDDGFSFGPQRRGITAPRHALFHPRHLAMALQIHKLLQPCHRFRQVWPGKAHLRETLFESLRAYNIFCEFCQ